MLRSDALTASMLLAAFAVVPASARAARGDAEACARAAEKAQDLRSSGRLLEARDRLRVCVAPVCPAFVRRDCAQWESDLEASIPTVVVAARSRDGRDLVEVRVTVDGAPFAESIDGIAKPLDPGEHRFRFEAAGSPPVEQIIVLREGEKRRAVEVTFAAPEPAATAPRGAPPASAEPPHAAADATSSTPTRGPWPWVLGGVGLVAASAGAALAWAALGDYHSLQQGCGATGACASSQVGPVRTRMWVADVAIASGVVSLGVAGWLALRPLPGGAAVQVGHRL